MPAWDPGSLVDFANPAEVGHHECQRSQKHGFGTADAVLHEDGVPAGTLCATVVGTVVFARSNCGAGDWPEGPLFG